MPTSLQIVDASDVVLFDLNDASGASNPGRVQTYFGVGGSFALLAPELSVTRFEPPSSPGGFTTSAREGLVASSWNQRIVAGSYDALVEGAGTLQRLLRSGGILKWLPEGSANTRYIDFEPSSPMALWGGADLEIHQLTHLFETPRGVPITVWRQPYLRGAELDPATNALLTNPFLLLYVTGASPPDGWSWSSAANITADAMDAAHEAYSFAIATTGARTLKSTQITGVAVPGDIWTGQIEASASDSVTARAALRLTALQSDGTTVTGTWDSAPVQLSPVPQRITVTTGALPALTARLRLDLAFTNLSATSVTVYVGKGQVEKSSVPSLFRAPPSSVANNPGSSGGRGAYVFIQGDAPAPVRVEAKADASAKLTDLIVAARGSGGTKGTNAVALFGSGAHVLQLEGGTLTNDTATTTDGSASGPGANVAQCTYASNPTVMAKRVRLTSTAFLATRRGRFKVYMRCKSTAAAAHVVQLRWGASAQDPPPLSLAEVSHNTTDVTTFDYVDLYMGTITIPDTLTSLTQLTFEIYARMDSGTGNLRMDFLSLVPADRVGRLYVPPGSSELWLGNQLVTPTSPGGLTAGDVFSNNTLVQLDTQNNAAATPPTGGVTYGAVRNVWEVDLTTYSATQVGAKIGEIRVRNVTDSTNVFTLDVKRKSGQNWYRRIVRVQFDGVAAKAYQLQVVYTITTAAGELIDVYSVNHEVSPFIASGEWLRSDPARGALEHLNSAKEYLGPVYQDGQSLLWLDPGLNFVYVHSADILDAGYNEPNSVLTRVPELRYTYSPRWRQ